MLPLSTLDYAATANLKRIPGTPHALAGSGWIMIDKSNARQYPF